VQTTYLSRFDRFIAYMCNNSSSAIRQAGCAAARSGGEPGAVAWAVANDRRGYWNNSLWTPTWSDVRGLYDYPVDREQGRFLPSVSAAIRPTGWLELYASWAKSWRPPAINESLMVGGHPGDPLTNMFPNPYADPEKTSSWEIGANLSFNDVVKPGDVFFAKVGYFDTRATDYLYTSLNNNLPGDNVNVPAGFGRVMFVNNRAPMHFRGFEIESRYDAGVVYAAVTATLYTGGRNTFCQDLYPVGVGSSRYDQPNEDGSFSAERQRANAAGFATWQAWAEAQTVCGDSVFNSVAGDRLDKASATVGVRLFDRRLDTGLRLLYSGSGGLVTYEDESAKAWERYATLDWYASFLLNRRVRVYASAENLLDRRYIDGSSDILARTWAPGRTVQAGLQVKF
jgi:heme acquisition protein HasR